MVSIRFGNSSLLLRLLRIVRLLAIGGRAVDRRVQLASSAPKAVEKADIPLEIQVMDGQLENNYESVPLITRRAEFHGLCPWVNEQAAI
jgi:hypothetical protein